MPRRSPYTKVEKENQIREEHVKGMGDVLFKGFQCLNPKCTEFLFVRLDEIVDAFDIECPECGFRMKSGEESKFYDYKLLHKKDYEDKSFRISSDVPYDNRGCFCRREDREI